MAHERRRLQHIVAAGHPSYGEFLPRLSRSRFTILVLVTLITALIAPVPWFAANSTGAANPGPPLTDAPKLTVVSINTAKVTEIEIMAKEIERHELLRDADVLFLQEVMRAGDGQLSSGEQLARRLQRNVAFASADGGSTHSGLAILSRSPLHDVATRPLKNVNLVFRSRKRIALAATVDTSRGPVRVINTHLDTRINPKARLEQLGPILDFAASFEGPVVLGGDFNTNDMQWVSHVVPVPYPGWQAAAVRKLMSEKGYVTPFQLRRATFDHLRMQLDWLFTNRLRPGRSAIQPLDFSDHHAIWAEFDLISERAIKKDIQ